MVHQIEPSLKDCNKKRAAISCNAYFGAPSVGALRIQSCGLNLATSPRETNTSACAKCESVPEGMVRQKSRNIRCGFSWCTMWEQTRTLLFIRAASASHGCSPGSDAVVPPREDKRGVLKYQGAFAAYPRSTNWAAVFHSPLDISPSLFFGLIAEQPTIPYSK